MLEYASFVIRNPSHVTKQWRNQYKTRKAMLTYRKANPICELTGSTKNLQVHHIIPVSVAPYLAGHPDNMIVLTKDAHFIMGHAGNWKHYNPNIRSHVENIKMILVKTIKSDTTSK